jgi:hypothetical protein
VREEERKRGIERERAARNSTLTYKPAMDGPGMMQDDFYFSWCGFRTENRRREKAHLR